jgi:hypothetical protein
MIASFQIHSNLLFTYHPALSAFWSDTVVCKILAEFEVFTAVTMKNAVFWDVTPCGSCKNRRFGGKYFFAAFCGY